MSKKFKVDKNNLKRGTKKKKSSSMPGIILVLGIGAGIFLSCKNYIPSSTKENSQHTAQKATPAAAQDSPEKSAKTEIAKPKVEKVESVKVDPKIHKFVETYCIRCHGEDKQKGDRRFDQLTAEIRTEDDIIAWTEILDSLNLGEMPPEKKNVKHPSKEENKFVISWLTDSLQSIESEAMKAETTLRRLNRFEYTQTVASLLNINIDAYDPTDLFPGDATEEGFDNIGEHLVLSDFQLKQYLAAAEKFIDKATFFSAQPPAKKMTFSAKDFKGSKKMARSGVFWLKNVDDKYLEIGHGRQDGNGVTYPGYFNRRPIAHDGFYNIRVKADAAHRLTHPYEPKDIHIDLTKKMKMALVAAHNRYGINNDRSKRHRIKIFELADNNVQWYEAKTWLNKDAIPFVHWINGSASTKNFINKVGYKYHPEIAENLKVAQSSSLRGQKVKIEGKILSDVYQGPVMRIHNFEIEGPFFNTWPPESHQALYGKEINPENLDVSKVLTNFASKAFRSPQTPESINHYISYVKQRLAQGDDKETAIKHGLKAILTSPQFLYLDEGAGGQLSQFQLASRLSYYFWSSQPDAELTQLAADGKLTNEVMAQQAKRMLKSPKAANFTKHFTDSWLRLNTLGSMPPDPGKFKAYYSDRIENAMRKETFLFFEHILKENRSIVDMLNSDYTFINDELADHYKIPNVVGEHFRKIKLPADSRRGGVLGQGSILTLTSNGVETSPVIRGIWILENILGTPPSPPPPDVDPIEPDTRGTTTIREQLEKHRSVEACAECHRKIDPLGFALENFDPVGKLRTHYPKKVRRQKAHLVDASGELPNGQKFGDERDLKEILVSKKSQFAKALTEKLMIYATGRKMTFKDHPEIERISEEIAGSGYKLQDLVVKITQSQIFKNK
ncbi:MAG: DUF1592 domain-containing protein [Lentisphaerales bacterium]|nr:DUF1592 domain-containing protein [Lentisphaerales bacterium]